MSYLEALRAGVVAAKAGKKMLARIQFEQATEINSHGVDGWLWMAWVADSPAQATEYVEIALARSPQHPIAAQFLSVLEAFNTCDAETCQIAAPITASPVPAEVLDSEPSIDESAATATDAFATDPPSVDTSREASSTEMPWTPSYTEEVDVEMPETDELAYDFSDGDETALDEEWDDDACEVTTDGFDDSSLTAIELELIPETPTFESVPVLEEQPLAEDLDVLPVVDNVTSVTPTAADDDLDDETDRAYADLEEAEASDFSEVEDSSESESTVATFTVSEADRNESPLAEATAAVDEVQEATPVVADVEPSVVAESLEDEVLAATTLLQSETTAAVSLELPACPTFEQVDVEPTMVESADDVSPTAVTTTSESETPVVSPAAEQVSSVEALTTDFSVTGGDAVEAESPTGYQGQTILAVDDSPTVLKLVKMTLESAGFHVVTAPNGVDAMKLLATMTPAMVLLDVNMPRMDGYKLCKLLKSHDKTRLIPVVMLSGKDGLFDKLRGKLVGCDDYISKPFESADLLNHVQRYVSKPAPVSMA